MRVLSFSNFPLHFDFINPIGSSAALEFTFVKLNSIACHCRIPTWDINRQKVYHVHTVSHAQVHSESTSKAHSLLNSGQNGFRRSIFSEALKELEKKDTRPDTTKATSRRTGRRNSPIAEIQDGPGGLLSAQEKANDLAARNHRQLVKIAA